MSDDAAAPGSTRRLSQREVPRSSRIFTDTLYDFARVAEFYPAGPPYALDALARRAADLRYPREQRARMVEILAAQNRAWGASAATLELLDRLAAPDAVAVVTGQQVGLLGGPLLGVHKALTAVKLAGQLRDQGVNAVPVFWMATQDHDLAEVNSLWARDASGALVRLQEGELPALAGAPVGGVALGNAADALIAQLAACTGATDAALAPLRAAYSSKATLASGFARLFTQWFAPWGLVLFDPLAASGALAPVLAPWYQRVLASHSELSAALASRGRALESAGYHVQVQQTAAATMLFLHRDGVRTGLRRIESGYRLGDDPIAAVEVEAWVRDRAGEVSPSALLRPLIQDVLLPTLTQVVGPAECAYLAQSAALYAVLGKRPAVVWPRASVTLIEAKARRLLDKHQLGVEELWRTPAEELLARRSLPPELEHQAARLRAGFDTGFATLRQQLEQLDSTLVEAATGAEQKIRHQLEQLEGRVARSFARRSQELAAQARYLESSLFPHHQLQERELAAADLALRLGSDPWSLLHARLDPRTPDHQLIDLA